MTVQIPREVVDTAWKTVQQGQTQLVGGYRVTKDPKGKMVLVTADSPIRRPFDLSKESPYSSTHARVVVFPRPEDVQHFERAMTLLEGEGPAEDNPGSVGSIIIRAERGNKPLHITDAQSHFRTTPEGAHGVLPRKYATKYGGWYERAVREALNIAVEHGTGMRVGKDVFYRYEPIDGRHTLGKLKRFDKAVRTVCKEMGLPRRWRHGELHITTRPRPARVRR